SAVKRRRCALATTSVSPTTGAALGEPPVALRAPSASPSCSIPSPRSRFSTTAIHRCLPALYSKLSPPRCLTLVGTEGGSGSEVGDGVSGFVVVGDLAGALVLSGRCRVIGWRRIVHR